MGDFFKGWRRKTSLALLAMALLLTVGWMRSYRIYDSIYIRFGQSSYFVESFVGRLSFVRWTPLVALNPDYDMQWTIEDFSQRKSGYRPVSLSTLADVDIEWWQERAGVSVGVGTSRSGTLSIRREGLRTRCWSLVLPLTLLSAYLLLTKPRSKKPPVSNPDATKTSV